MKQGEISNMKKNYKHYRVYAATTTVMASIAALLTS